MKINKFCISILLFIFCITTVKTSYADIDLKENINVEDLNKTIEASSNITEIPTINSRAAIIFDRTSKTVLYGKHETQKKKMASTTKIMTAIIILENCKLTDTVQVSKKAASIQGSRLGLTSNCKITVNDLLYGLMLCSGNDAAVALAEHTAGNIENFANMMNKKAKELRLENTNFVTPHGLDNNDHYTTAYELAILTDYALQNKTFSNIVATKNYTVTINQNPKSIHNTNELLGNLNGIYGVKTGFTNGANRCLVTACKRGNLDVICIVLGADTKKFRSQDSIKLLEYTFANYQMINIEEQILSEFNKWKSENLSKINIDKISNRNDFDLEISSIQTPIIPLKNEEADKISIEISCTNTLTTPLKSKVSVGKISVLCNNTEILQLDILSKNDLKRKNILDNFIELITNYKQNLEANF